MAGFYNVLFTNVAKKPSSECLSVNMAEPTESFMSESCQVLPLGENRKLDKDMNTYLTHYKGMTRKNVSQTKSGLNLIFSLFLYCFFRCSILHKNSTFFENKKANTRTSPVGPLEIKIHWPI